VTCSLYTYGAAICHQDALDLAIRLHVHLQRSQQRMERRDESAGTANDYWKTGTVQSGCKQGSHQTTSGVIRRKAGMQQPRRVQMVNLVSAEVPARISPAAGNCGAQPPFGAAQPAALDEIADMANQRKGAHLVA